VSERTLAGKTLPEPLRGYLQSLIPKAAKGKVQLSLKNYLLAVSEGELPAPRFEEDAANLLMMYMDYSDELIAIRKEARGRSIHASVSTGRARRISPVGGYALALRELSNQTPSLKPRGKSRCPRRNGRICKASVQQVPVKPVQVEKKPEVKPAAKPEVKLVAKPEVKPEVKLAAKPEVKSVVKPVTKPGVKPAVKPTVLPTAKPGDNKKRRGHPMPLDDAPIDTDQKLSASVEDTPLVEAERNIIGMARILNLMNRLTRAGEPAKDQLFRETAAGEIDWNYLEDQLQALGIKGTLIDRPPAYRLQHPQKGTRRFVQVHLTRPRVYLEKLNCSTRSKRKLPLWTTSWLKGFLPKRLKPLGALSIVKRTPATIPTLPQWAKPSCLARTGWWSLLRNARTCAGGWAT